MTDNEIIQILKNHIEAEACVSCESFGKCDEFLITEKVLDLINRQQAELERLQKESNLVSIQFQALQERTNDIKADTYKEFAEKVKEEIKKAYDNNSRVLREHIEKHDENPNFEFISAVTGKINTLKGLDDFIDNLVKEMAGEGK